jgi:hypothetical protein
VDVDAGGDLRSRKQHPRSTHVSRRPKILRYVLLLCFDSRVAELFLKNTCLSRYIEYFGTDVMITIFCEFCPFSAKKLAFFSKTNVMITFSAKLPFVRV